VIKIRIVRNTFGNIIGYSISGHAGFDEYGKDVVCAAVSMAGQMALLGLTQLLSADVQWEMTSGNLNCRLNEQMDDDKMEKCQVILETMVLGLKDVAKQYKSYIDIIEEEVLRNV
jgi:uncharacterized protein YsxB (DUF464 family)